MPDDAELLRRYVDDRSEAAFAELVERHFGLVYAAALRQLGGSAHRAQDVAQTVFIDLARKARPLARRAELGGWLYTSTHFAAAKLKRGQQRRQHREQEAHLMHLTSSAAPFDLDWDRLRPVLDDAMHGLGENDREAILLRFFQGRRFADVGRRFGLSEDGARMRVERALDKLRTLLAQRGITSTTAALTIALASPALTGAPAGLAATVATAALSGSAMAGGSVAAGTALFMSKKTLLVSTVALLAIGTVAFQFNRAREAGAAARAEIDRLQAGLRAAQQRAVMAEQQTAALRSEVSTMRSDQAKATLASTTRPPSAQGAIVFSAVSAAGGSTPSGMTLKEAFSTSFAALFRQLGWTAEQRAQFVALMVEVKEHGSELFRAALAAGTTPDREFARQVYAQTDQEREAKLRAAFGDATFQAFQHFEATRSLRWVTEQLVGRLFDSDTPLQPVQADQLVAVMASNARNSTGKIDLLAMNNDAVLTQAQGKTKNTHVIVERIVTDIDSIVKQVRFDGWQATAQGEREVKQALRRTLLKYKLHTDQELFDKAYGYIRQYY